VSRGAALLSSGIGLEEESVRVFWNILYMALPLCFVPSYSNVLERILLDGDFHDFCGPKQASTLPNSKHEWHMKHSTVNSQITICCRKQ
jgi:hypothetical protein